MSAPALQVDGLQVAYGPVVAVHGVDLFVEQGELVALTGANGAGKTSTLRAIMGLEPARGGSVRLDGADVTSLAPEVIAGKGMTLSPEGRRVFARLTVEENLRLGAVGGGDAAPPLEEILQLFPRLVERRRQLAGTMSGGEQQQLALARALMSHPHVLLLDEPSLGLAPVMVDVVFDILAQLRERGLAIVLVEQNVDRAFELASRAYVLSGGSVVAEGTPDDLLHGSTMVDAYLGIGATP